MTRYMKVLVAAVVLMLSVFFLVKLSHSIELDFGAYSLAVIQHAALCLLLVLMMVISYSPLAYINRDLLSVMNIRMGASESFQLSIITGFYNVITPFRGGMAVRAVYLKKHYAFSYTDFLATTAATYIITFLIAGLVGLVTTALLYARAHTYSALLGVVFAITTAGMVVLMLLPKLQEPKHRWLSKLVRVVNGWHIVRRHPRVVLSITLLTAAQLVIGAVMLLLQFRVFGVPVDLTQALFLASIGSLGILIAITPAGLGISEAITVFSALTIGITPAQSLAAAILGRLVSVVVLFILGPIFTYTLLHRSPRALRRELNRPRNRR